MTIEKTEWRCLDCGRPVIDRDPYAIDRKITPFVTIGDLMRRPRPCIWRPFARRSWERQFAERAERVLAAHHAFEIRNDVTTAAIREEACPCYGCWLCPQTMSCPKARGSCPQTW